MFVVLGTEMGTDSISQLLGSEKPGGLHHLALAVGPPRLDWIQPGALDRQVTRDDPNPFAFLLHLAVVASNPAAHFLADMPRSVVPRHQERLLAKPGQPIYGPFQEPYRHRADRPTVDESQPDHLFDRPVGVYQSDQEAIGREGFRVGIVFGDRLLDQAQRLLRLGPGGEGRLGHSAPPGLVLEAQHPFWMHRRQSLQSVASTFFRAYSGSGLVIHCLARRQRMPSRASVARIVSPVTRAAVMPWSKLISAASGKVHRLVGLPKFRGLWCKSARR